MHLRFSTFGLTLSPQKFHTGGVDGNHPLSGKNHHWSTLIGLWVQKTGVKLRESQGTDRPRGRAKEGPGIPSGLFPIGNNSNEISVCTDQVCPLFGASLVAQMVKNLPAVRETRVPKWSLALLRPPSKRFSLPLSSLLFCLFHPGHNTLIEIILSMVFIIFFRPLHPWIVSFMGLGILSVLFMALFLHTRSIPGT